MRPDRSSVEGGSDGLLCETTQLRAAKAGGKVTTFKHITQSLPADEPILESSFQICMGSRWRTGELLQTVRCAVCMLTLEHAGCNVLIRLNSAHLWLKNKSDTAQTQLLPLTKILRHERRHAHAAVPGWG